MTDKSIEQEIQDKGLTAPRVTPTDIEAEIDGEYFFTAADGVQGVPHHLQDEIMRMTGYHESLRLLTFCVLHLRNGFTVTGESACASPENFDADIGRKIARQNAVAKIWPLVGFRLRDTLAVQDVQKRNRASHDLQRIGQGGVACVRCMTMEQMAHEHFCDDKLAR
ncbi:Gp49 family protein [Xanthomonas axonopodis pv. nakataecorchori]|uniref:Gp49 family protein n=1 Tax=Xanthomonas axonopodis TaxID=53413 RepID=UPI003530BCFA